MQTSTAKLVPILANPYSGSGPNRRHVDDLVEGLRDLGFESRVVWDHHERAELLSDPLCDEMCHCLVTAGGDGSLADVINEMPMGLPIAVLPLGNENLFARQFGFTREGKKTAQAIARGNTLTIDVGAAGDRLFTLMASVGFDGEVVRHVDRWRSNREAVRRVNRWSYLPRILAAVREYDYPPITLEADGQRVTASHVFAFNLPQYGMGLGIAKGADAEDGLLDWVAFEKPGLLNLGTYAMSVYLKRHEKRKDVLHGRAKHIRITAEATVPTQADGDPAGATPIDITIRPKALRVVQVG